jgi:hypothetical protein
MWEIQLNVKLNSKQAAKGYPNAQAIMEIPCHEIHWKPTNHREITLFSQDENNYHVIFFVELKWDR